MTSIGPRRGILVAIVSVAIAYALRSSLTPVIGPTSAPLQLFFLAVFITATVGGQWPGNPDSTTTFPQEMRIDYVRVYDKS